MRSTSCTCLARMDVNYNIYYDAHRSAQADAREYRELERIRSRYLLCWRFILLRCPSTYFPSVMHFICKIISAKLNWYILKKGTSFFVTFCLNSICIYITSPLSVLMLFTKIIISRNCMINVLHYIKRNLTRGRRCKSNDFKAI